MVRLAGILDGISFLVLLGIAMPLKYVYGMPGPVRVTGMIHGILFLLFIVGLVRVAGERNWPRRRLALGIVAATLPFGTFWFDRHLR